MRTMHFLLYAGPGLLASWAWTAAGDPLRGVVAERSAVEDRGGGCAIAALPEYESLAEIPLLPDPFLAVDGHRIVHRVDWTCRRAEIAAQVQYYELGPKPLPPQRVAGSIQGGTLTVSVEDDGRAISFDVPVLLPDGRAGPWPAMIVLGGRTGLDAEQAISGLGVAMILFDNNVIAAQHDTGSRGQGKFYELYPDHPAGAMMAWAWAVSRLIDALQGAPDTNIDPLHVGITGCSRNGKGALVAGAFDERIALTIPQESGAGGVSLWRLADVHQQAWIDAGRIPEYGAVQTLAQIVTENVWFRESFRQFAASATRLPFDHHMVMGLVAPRALLVIDNTDQWWLDREGSYFGAVIAHDIWSALGRPDHMGVSQRGGHPHCRDVPRSQLDTVAAYVRRFLLDERTVSTGIQFSDGGFPDNRDRWVDWDVPGLD
jgi:(4-O-methyl)-D-glucuronate---lignin esterase